MNASVSEPVVLQGRRRWAGLWFGIAALGAAGGITMVTGGAWAGWFLVVVFLPSAVVLGMALRPQANELRLDRSGYTVTGTFRATTVPWRNVERVGVIEGIREPLVAIRFTPAAVAGDPEADEIARAMGGYHRTLPLTYGVEATELSALMERFRAG